MAVGPLYAQIPGQLGYQTVYLPTGHEVLSRQNPLLLLANMAKGEVAKYVGNTNAKQTPLPIKFLTVNSPEFQFYEFDPERTRSTTLVADINTTQTSITLTSASGFGAKDLIKITSTGEQMRITSINSSSGVAQVERAFSSTLASNTTFPSSLSADSAASATSGDTVLRISPAMEEGSHAIQRERNTATRRIGHTQILRTDIVQTGTQMAQDPTITIAEERYGAIKNQELGELYIDHEHLAYFGKLNRASRDGEVIRTTEGIYDFISTNSVAASGLAGAGSQFTLDKLEDMSYRSNKRGGKKVFLVGNEGFRYIAKVAIEKGATTLNVNPGENKYGISPDMFMTIFGNIDLVYYPLMDYAPYNKNIVAIDPDQLFLCNLKDRALQWKDNTQQNDYDGRSGRWLAEIGVVPCNEKMHSKYTAFTFFS